MPHFAKQIIGTIEGRAVHCQHFRSCVRDGNRVVNAEGLRGCFRIKNDEIVTVDNTGVFVSVRPTACINGDKLASCQSMIGGRRKNVVR